MESLCDTELSMETLQNNKLKSPQTTFEMYQYQYLGHPKALKWGFAFFLHFSTFATLLFPIFLHLQTFFSLHFYKKSMNDVIHGIIIRESSVILKLERLRNKTSTAESVK